MTHEIKNNSFGFETSKFHSTLSGTKEAGGFEGGKEIKITREPSNAYVQRNISKVVGYIPLLGIFSSIRDIKELIKYNDQPYKAMHILRIAFQMVGLGSLFLIPDLAKTYFNHKQVKKEDTTNLNLISEEDYENLNIQTHNKGLEKNIPSKKPTTNENTTDDYPAEKGDIPLQQKTNKESLKNPTQKINKNLTVEYLPGEDFDEYIPPHHYDTAFKSMKSLTNKDFSENITTDPISPVKNPDPVWLKEAILFYGSQVLPQNSENKSVDESLKTLFSSKEFKKYEKEIGNATDKEIINKLTLSFYNDVLPKYFKSK